MKILATVLSIVGIFILTFAALPKERRPKWARTTYKKIKTAEYIGQNLPRLKEQYEDYKARGYPYTKPEEREMVTETRYIKDRAKVDVENMFFDGRLKYPWAQLTDTRLLALGAILEGIGLLIQIWLLG